MMEMTPEERRKHLAKFDPFVGIDKLCKSDAILLVGEPGPKNERFVHPSPQKRFDTGLLLFDNS